MIQVVGWHRLLRVQPATPQWVEGRCLSYAANTAYRVWLDVVRGLLGVAPDAPAALVRDALQRGVRTSCPDCYEDVYPYMARLLSLSPDEGTEAVLRGLGAEGLKVSTFRAVETLVELPAQRHPLVLVCEDLHWADPTSLEPLERLLPLADHIPLLLLCILRPERAHGRWRIVETAARDYPHCHTDLRLGPLCAAESETLVGNLLSLGFARDATRRVKDLPEGLRSSVLDHAEGNPFFVEEIRRSLIDGGIIAHDQAADSSTGIRTGRWYATRDVSDMPIPDTLHGDVRASTAWSRRPNASSNCPPSSAASLPTPSSPQSPKAPLSPRGDRKHAVSRQRREGTGVRGKKPSKPTSLPIS
jgi:hypothetical protein